jgi:drug/metabolite transporter (DMT)-like permease
VGLADRRTAGVVAALATVYVVWGSTYLGIALAIETLPPLSMAAVRFLVAGALLYLVARRFERRTAARPDRRQWLAAAVTGTFLLAIGNGGVSWAQQTVPSGIAALVIASIPLWIAVLGRLAFRERLSLLACLGIGIGFAGVALLVNPLGGGAVDPVGGLLLLLAAAGWSVGTLLSRGTRLTVSPLVGAGMQMLCGGIVLAAAALVAGEVGEVRLAEVSARSVGGLLYLIVFGSILAFSAYVWLLRNAATSLVSTYAYVNPVVAVFLGWLVLGEAISLRTLVAGGVVLAAVALIVSARPALPARSGSSRRAPSRTAGRSRAAAATRGR